MNKHKIFSITALAAFLFLATQTRSQEKPLILYGGTAHIGDGRVIEHAAIGIENGIITFVADATTIRIDTNKASVIDVTGQQVYPGLIAPNTTLGLTEIDAVRATHDYQETGTYNPNVRSLIAYNTDSKIIPTVRSNGILLAQVCPTGGRISGTSSIMALDGWNWEDAAFKADDGIHLNWPSRFRFTGWWAQPGGIEPNEKYDQQVANLERFFSEARAYAGTASHEVTNLKFEAMRGLFDHSKKLYVHVNQAREILAAVDFAQRYGLDLVLVGARDAWKVADQLAKAKVPVILAPVFRIPATADEDYDQPYKTAAMLQKAGVLYCLSLKGSWEQRNLMFEAGMTTNWGLSREEALASVTSNTARILGIDDLTGTLEEGKQANIIVSTGDLLDMKTSQVTLAFIRGEAIDLWTHQKELNRIYLEKYGLDK